MSTTKVLPRPTWPCLPKAKSGRALEFKGLHESVPSCAKWPEVVLSPAVLQTVLGNLRHCKRTLGTPASGLQTVNQFYTLNQRGRTPVELADDHRAQRLVRWHLGPKMGYTSWKGIHNVKSKVVPVHPGNQGRNSDPGTRNCHTVGRARNRVSRLAHLPDWVCGSHNIAGSQAYRW
eukprot:4191154-Amphidinium_carterae.2